jgi:quinol monooxygenase YgiN/tetratricopeptide (TPR) repeat protein
MIPITVRLVASPAADHTLLRHVKDPLLEPTRAEPGCLRHRFSHDVEDPTSFSFVEEWADSNALDGHFRSEHVGGSLAAVGDLPSEAPEARSYDIPAREGWSRLEDPSPAALREAPRVPAAGFSGEAVSSRLTRCALLAVAMATALLGSASAAAQTTAAERVSAEHLVELGRQHLSTGADSLGPAIELFYTALAEDIDFVPALVGLSEAYRLQAPWDGGDRTGLDRAIAFGEKAVHLDVHNADAHLALGRAYLGKRWYRQALLHFRRLQDLRPDAAAAYWIGWMGIEMGDYRAASVAFERAYALDSTDTWMPLYIGVAERTLGNSARAEEMLRRGLEAHPNNRSLNANLGLLFIQNGRADDAVAQAEMLVERDPEAVEFLTTAASANWYAGRDSAALRLFERAMEKADGADPFIGWWGTYTSTALGDLYMRAGRHAEAEVQLARSEAGYLGRLRETGEGWGYLYDLARVHAVRGDREEALRWLREAVRFGFPEVYLAELDPVMSWLREDDEYERLLSTVRTRIGEMRSRLASNAELFSSPVVR